jgi:uncharacterized protein (TIGR02118 family)
VRHGLLGPPVTAHCADDKALVVKGNIAFMCTGSVAEVLAFVYRKPSEECETRLQSPGLRRTMSAIPEPTMTRRQTMIKVSVMYPNGPDARFDGAYYRDQHMPMVKRLMGDSLRYYTIDQAMDDGSPSSNAPYIAMGHLLCDSVDAFQAGFGPHTKEIMDDIPNYTNQTPVIQISEVVVGQS